MKKLLSTFIVMACFAMVCEAKNETKNVPPLKYGSEQTVINGRIAGEKSEYGKWVYLECQIGLSEEPTTDSVAVAADGTFTLTLAPVFTKKVDMKVCGKMVSFIVEPGETVGITVRPELSDKQKEGKKVAYEFTGKYADLNTSMANYEEFYTYHLLLKDYNGQGLSKFAGMDVQGFRQTLMKVYDEAIARLASDKRLCPAYREYETTMYRIQIFSYMTGYRQILSYANRTQNSEQYTLPDDYWNGVKDWNPTADNAILYSMYWPNLDVLVRQANALIGEECYTVPQSSKPLLQAQEYAAQLNEYMPLTDEQKSAVRTECPVFADFLLKHNDEIVARLEESKAKNLYSVKHLDESLAGEDVFKALISDYKGKPLLVDFWATWCGPCKAAMKTILPVKEQLWGKANFIYITGPSSPAGTWKNMIPDIHGDHYYVTADQYNTLLKQFDSTGIPTYVIVDSEGNVVTSHIGYPGNDVIKKELGF